MTDIDGYRHFEQIAATHPDEAWNIAYRAGQAKPEPTEWVPMERLRDVVLGLQAKP